MDVESYRALVREQLTAELPIPIARDDVIRQLPQPARYNMVHIITGMRRCGKTFYLFQLMHRLTEEGVPRARLFYFDFSDSRLRPLDADAPDRVLDEYWRQVPQAREEGCYLFLDEVQELNDWQGFCQRVAEHERVTLVITGSSSKVSSDEIASSFRGRSHVHVMWPLSFSEFCRFHAIALPDPSQNAFSPQEQVRYEAAYDEYLVCGGFPGVQDKLTADRIEILQGYVRDVVARDVAERAGRAEVSLAMQLALFTLRNTACEVSANEMVKRLEEAGYKAYWEKVRQLLELLRQAYLIHTVSPYSTMLLARTTAVSKVYAEDPGLVYAVSRASQQDVGKRLETAVFIELSRRFAGYRTDTITSLTMPTPRHEKVDFLVGDALGVEPYELVQVTADMSSEKTRQREFGSLEAGMRTAHLERGTIVTLYEHGTFETASGRVEVVPAWLWSLGSSLEKNGSAASTA